MKKYYKLLVVAIQNSTTYRVESFNWFIIAAIATISSFVIFTTATKQGAVINYTPNQIGLYVFFSLVVERLVGWYYCWDLDYAINNGKLSAKLIKPYNTLFQFGINEFGYKITGNIPYAVVALLALLVYAIYASQLVILNILLFLLSIFISAAIGFYIAGILGSISFWTNRSSAFIQFFQYVGFYAMGRYFPLDIFPEGVIKVLNLTPFPYIVFYPLTGLIRQESAMYFISLVGIQLIWLLVMVVISKIVWVNGLKKYESTGI